MAKGNVCSVDGCEKPAMKYSALCSMHRHRWAKYRSTENPTRPRRVCSIEGCDRLFYGRGYCSRHWEKWHKYGDPLFVFHDGLGYMAMHGRVREIRGRAPDYTCVRCGRRAYEWAYDHSDPNELIYTQGTARLPFSRDVNRYMPMCRSCHSRFDKEHK